MLLLYYLWQTAHLDSGRKISMSTQLGEVLYADSQDILVLSTILCADSR
jgi:hypothetical protein